MSRFNCSTLVSVPAQDAIALLRKASAQAKGLMHARRANLINGYMHHTKRCGFLWLKRRPLTDREVAHRIRESRNPTLSIFDAAWVHIDGARLDAERLSSTARGLISFTGTTVFLSADTVRDIVYYLGSSSLSFGGLPSRIEIV